jgi:hypothetical protein
MKADVLALVQLLSNEQADPTATDKYYDEAVLDLGQLPILVDATLIAVGGAGGLNNLEGGDGPPDNSYPLPDWVIQPLQWYYGDTILPEATASELMAFNRDWVGLVGTPRVIYRDEDFGARRFRLVPKPDRPSAEFDFFLGSPFGKNYPRDTVGCIHTLLTQDLPQWLELPVAFFVLAKEFTRESDHQDTAFAAVCATMGQALLEMVR